MAKKKQINPFQSPDYTEKSLTDMWGIISKIAREEYKLDFYEPYFEVCTFEEMLQIYTTSFPIMFNHWSFGAQYEQLYKQYKNNRASIAYEVIFNTDPALCYLLETNSSVMMGLVMCHAACGHSAFFKGNEFIKENTNAKTIIPFMRNFRSYVTDCESKYGNKRVEEVLDVCKSLSLYSIDRADTVNLTGKQQQERAIRRKEEKFKDFDIKVAALDINENKERGLTTKSKLREENILKFIANNSPTLKDWERTLILMYCKHEQYFYPQMFTKLMNEGYASFWHYTLMHRLYDLGYLKDGDILEFLHSHCGVLCQRDHDQPGYSGINVYSLGYAIFNDIKRICTDPTDEDRRFSPGLIGKDWIEEVNFAMQNFKDESFILQYLSPKVMRDFKLFSYKNDTLKDHYEITGVHSDEDYKQVRAMVAQNYNLFGKIPTIYVEGFAEKKSRALYLVNEEFKDVGADVANLLKTMSMIKKLWPFGINMKVKDFNGDTHILPEV